MKENEIKKVIEKGESSTVEFKKSLSLRDEIGEALSAFSNSNGGMVLVGVDDSKTILGADIGKKTLEDLANFIKQNTDGPIYPELSVEGKKIIMVYAEEQHEKPIFFKGKAYKRLGKSTHRLSASEIRKLAKEAPKELSWDERVCESSSISDINSQALARFKSLYEEFNQSKIKGSSTEILKALKCVKKHNGKIRLTNAGVLLFSKKPEKFFPMSYATVVRYPGNKSEETYLDIKEFYGNLFDIVDNVEEYIKQHVQEISKVIEGKLAREIIPQYPYFALRELITNAVVHRDYSIRGSRIIIRMFRGRIEFISPGGLPGNIKPENIIFEQYSRNPVISEAFSKVKYIEKLGEGWDKITEFVKAHPLHPRMPEIRDTKNTLIITLFSPKEEFLERVTEKYPEKYPERLAKTQNEIIGIIKSNPLASRREIAERIGLSLEAIKKNISILKKKGLLKRIGPDKGGRWEANE